MKKCPSCQKEYEDSQKFCSECGAILTEVPETPAEPAPAPVEETGPMTVPGEAPAPEPEEKSAEEPPAEADKPAELAPPPETKPKREKKKVGAGRRILAVLLCLLLFVFLLIPALGYAVRRATTAAGLEAVLEDVDLARMSVAPYFDDVDDPELTFSEMLSEDLGKAGLKIGESTMTKVLNSSAMKNYLAGEAAQLCADIYRGRSSYEFDPDTLRDELLTGKTARVLEKEKFTLTATEAGTVADLLTGYGLDDFLSRDVLKTEAPGLLRVMNIGFSYVTIIVLTVLAAALCVLIFKVNRWSVGHWFSDIGWTALLVGFVLLLTTLIARAFPGIWETICGGLGLAAVISGGVLAFNLRISLILFAVGVLLALLGRLIRRGFRKKEKTAE